MTGRALVFSNPQIIRLIRENFVPVAADDWYHRRQQDDRGRLFRKVALQRGRWGGDSTRQGLYCFTCDELVIASQSRVKPVALVVDHAVVSVRQSPQRNGRSLDRHTIMATIPQTRKKLRETEFFFRQLTGTKEEIRLDSEEFDFYLSAFLSAGRSVTFALQVEDKELYDRLFPAFKENLDDNDHDLLQFMNRQRVAEVHQGGAAVESDVEFIPVTVNEDG